MVEIYTDGGCRKNPGIGAWAFVVVEDNSIEYNTSCFCEYTTNNQMELTAIYRALLYLNMFGINDAVVYSDSQYSINAINIWFAKWVKTNSLSNKKNIDLLTKISNLKTSNIKIMWIKGHASNHFNNLADKLVNDAMDSAR